MSQRRLSREELEGLRSHCLPAWRIHPEDHEEPGARVMRIRSRLLGWQEHFGLEDRAVEVGQEICAYWRERPAAAERLDVPDRCYEVMRCG